MQVNLPDGSPIGAIPSITLFAAGEDRPLATAVVAEGRVDLAALFPMLWAAPDPGVRYAQLLLDEQQLGPAVVLAPLWTPSTTSDGFNSALEQAYEDKNADAFARLIALDSAQAGAMRQTVHSEPPELRVLSGLRAWADRDIVLETSAGKIRVRLRHDEAPTTAYHFLQLVEGGLYTQTIIHRIINADARGSPFIIQAGDPTGLGYGGCGFRIDYEPSTLAHDFGVLSLARRPFDPNSGGSQFFICLSRDACAPLDGLYVAFAQAVTGADVIQTIASVEVGHADPENPGTAPDRPLDPPTIKRAYVVPAPPIGQWLPRVTPPNRDVER